MYTYTRTYKIKDLSNKYYCYHSLSSDQILSLCRSIIIFDRFISRFYTDSSSRDAHTVCLNYIARERDSRNPLLCNLFATVHS